MESKRVSFAVLLLLIGAVVMVAAQDNHDDGPACIQICYTDAAYMTCPSTGYEKLKPACNCCIGGPGCSLYRENGEQIC